MKNSIRWASLLVLAFMAIFFAPLALLGADAAAPAQTNADPFTSLSYAIPFVSPLLVSLVKKWIPAIPKGWLPVACATFGLLLALIEHLATGSGVTVGQGLLLGAAGVMIREAIDQAKKASAASTVVLVMLFSFLLGGCATSPLVTAQQIETGANDTLNLFVKLEYQNRAFIKKNLPAVSAFADKLVTPVEIVYRGQKKTVPWGKSLIFSLNEARRAAKESYLAAANNPTPELQAKANANAATLQAALAAVRQLIDEANEQIFAMQKIKTQN